MNLRTRKSLLYFGRHADQERIPDHDRILDQDADSPWRRAYMKLLMGNQRQTDRKIGKRRLKRGLFGGGNEA